MKGNNVKREKSRPSRVLLIILCCLLIIFAAVIIANHIGTSYDSLNSTDQKVLSELNAYCKADKAEPFWRSYKLSETPIVAISGRLGGAYLIDPDKKVSSLFAARVKLPKSYGITVYRVSAAAPQLLKFKLSAGSFNTLEKTYTLFGNKVYYTRYNKKESIDAKYTSSHYITLLSHEAFHYYMQNSWGEGSRFGDSLSRHDLSLIADEYDILGDVQSELYKSSPSNAKLNEYARSYVAVMKKRIAANPSYLKQELDMEVAEGTAQYVCIKASRAAGYDYGIMYFTNKKNVSFKDVMPEVYKGKIKKSYLADGMPYETGAQLCFLLDRLYGGNSWQTIPNSQTKGHYITLYDVIRDKVSQQ